MRNDVIFTTICINGSNLDEDRTHQRGWRHYIETTRIFISSVLKHSNGKIVLVTDVPDEFESNERVIIYDIRQMTNEPFIVRGYFNLHLKRWCLKKAFEFKENYVIYMDCDVFLSEQLSVGVLDELDSITFDVAGRLGLECAIKAMQQTTTMSRSVIESFEKVKEFGSAWSDEYVNAMLPNELFFIFKRNDVKQSIFLDTWDAIAEQSIKYLTDSDKPTYADSYYFGCSIFASNMNTLELVLDLSAESHSLARLFYESIKVIHANNINSINFGSREPYDYITLLNRMK